MIRLSVRALLYSADKLLLFRRIHTGFGDGFYSLPGGWVGPEEPALDAVVRKVQEETGLYICSAAFESVHTFHRKSDDLSIIVLCFKADITGLVPNNAQPEKHDAMNFFSENQLPENILPAHKQAIECVKNNIAYSQHGW